MPLPAALLFQTRVFDAGMARLFDTPRRQCPPHFTPFVLMHVPVGTPKPPRLASVPHHFVSTAEVRALGYPRKNAKRGPTGKPWDFWLGGHCDLVAMHFFSAYPDFERYWVVEYDVRFTGNWRAFFDAFEDSPSDFLSASVRRRRDNPAWVNWASVQGPAGVAEEEIERHRVGAFTPPYRASRRAMETMDTPTGTAGAATSKRPGPPSSTSTAARWRTSAATASSCGRATATASTPRPSPARAATCWRRAR